MHTIPALLPEGITKEQHREMVIAEIDAALAAHNLTRAYLRRIGTFTANAVLRGCDLTRDSIEKILTFAGIEGPEASKIWRTYVGRQPVTVQDHLQAYLRMGSKFTELEEKAGFGASRIEYYLYGQKRTNGKGRIPPKFPDYPFWKAIAPHMGFSEKKAYAIWIADARNVWAAQRNALGAEVEVLFQEYGVSGYHWIHRDRPPSLREFGRTKLHTLLSELRHGRLKSLHFIQKFCDALALPPQRRDDLFKAVVDTVLLEDPRLNEYPQKAFIRETLLLRYLAGEDIEKIIAAIVSQLDSSRPGHRNPRQVSKESRRKKNLQSLHPDMSAYEFMQWVAREFSQADAAICDQFGSVYLTAMATLQQGQNVQKAVAEKIAHLRAKFMKKKNLTVCEE